MSTKINFVYADASNYKKHGEAVFAGAITDSERASILAALDGDGFFIPEQVGLTNPRDEFGGLNAEDHVWCSLGDGWDAATSAFEVGDFPLTDPRTAREFAREFARAGQQGWDVSGWSSTIGIDDTPVTAAV